MILEITKQWASTLPFLLVTWGCAYLTQLFVDPQYINYVYLGASVITWAYTSYLTYKFMYSYLSVISDGEL